MKVSCVIPTRGNVDLEPVLEPIYAAGIEDVVVWDNSKEIDLGVFGRYAAILRAKHEVIVTQDDDVVVTCWDQLLEEYEPGRLVTNYPEPWDIPWIDRGAIFDRDLPFRAFKVYLEEFPFDRLFTHRIADAVFPLLSDFRVVDLGGAQDLPVGYMAGRISTSEGWYDRDRPEAKRRCELLKAAA